MPETRETVTPALTAEEWRFAHEQMQGSDPEEPLTDEERIARTANHAVYLLEGGMPYDATALHGAAAVALYDQPFGFTRDDLAAIDEARCFMIEEYESGTVERRAALERVYAKIAALLP